MGPLFGPILFAFVINLSLKQSISADDESLNLPVLGADHAPNLMHYLESQNILIEDAPNDRDAAIRAVLDGVHDVVLIVPASIGKGPGERNPGAARNRLGSVEHQRRARSAPGGGGRSRRTTRKSRRCV